MPQMTMYVASTWSLCWLSGAAVGTEQMSYESFQIHNFFRRHIS